MHIGPRLGAIGVLTLGACQAPGSAGARNAPLFDDLGSHHHAVRTENSLAQRYFDQGLVLAYGFNHAEAARAFREAARLDPACSMAWWGIAWVLGPNINKPMDAGDAAEAVEASTQALATAATKAERLYAEAIRRRYASPAPEDRKPFDEAFASAMREVARALPDDLDAATIYAEALMDLSPWDYWTKGGEPRNHALEIVEVLEDVLERNPEHPGALHYYLHAVEASQTPGRAEWVADRLGPLVPGAGHLVHMPAHIYMRIGRYNDASIANEKAALSDESYISQCRAQGFYPAVYYPHNIHFLWAAAAMEGRSDVAIEAARRLVRAVDFERIPGFPPLEEFVPIPYCALARFAQWDELLAEPAPPSSLHYARGIWDHAVGLALVAKGRLAEAKERRARIAELAATDEMKALILVSSSTAAQLLEIADVVLGAEIAQAEGRSSEAIEMLANASALQDALPYTEPPPWYFPIRQWLGRRQLDAGDPVSAEATFRRELAEFPHNGWSLHGLEESLRAQGRHDEATDVNAAFRSAWAIADITLGPGSACCGAAGSR